MSVELSYFGVQRRLGEIDVDLAERMPEYEKAARDFAKAKRDYEKAWAEAYVKAEGSNDSTRKANTIIAIWQSQAYRDLVQAEASFEGSKAVAKVLETRANIGMALLKSMTREHGAVPERGPQPQFSNGAGQ